MFLGDAAAAARRDESVWFRYPTGRKIGQVLIQPIVSFGPDSLRLDECLLAVSVNILQFGANKSRGSAGYRVAIWATLTELVSLNHSDASLDRKPQYQSFAISYQLMEINSVRRQNFKLWRGKNTEKGKKMYPVVSFFLVFLPHHAARQFTYGGSLDTKEAHDGSSHLSLSVPLFSLFVKTVMWPNPFAIFSQSNTCRSVL